MTRRMFFTSLLALLIAWPVAAHAQKPIKVGFPIILSGPGALFGEPYRLARCGTAERTLIG